jgi:DNA-binding XRE family transcriptional regulator
MTGKELRELREGWGLTQSGLADILGLKGQSISDMERGKMKISKSVENHVLAVKKLRALKEILDSG